MDRHIIGSQRPAIPGGYIKATETGKNSSSPSFHEVAPVSHDGLGEVPQGGAIIWVYIQSSSIWQESIRKTHDEDVVVLVQRSLQPVVKSRGQRPLVELVHEGRGVFQAGEVPREDSARNEESVVWKWGVVAEEERSSVKDSAYIQMWYDMM